MEIDTSVMEDFGLTKAQIKVYLALLELGESTSGPIIKRSALQNSVVYNALGQLIEHGLATFILQGKRKYFSATDPKYLIKFVDDKRERIKELIAGLTIKQKLAEERHEATVFLGWKGVYTAFNFILEVLPKGSDYIGFATGYEEQHSEDSRKFFREFQKKRHNMKYKVNLIVNESARNQVKQFEYYPEFGRPEYRFVPGYAPVGVTIFEDCVLNVALEENPVAVLIRSKLIAESFRRSFYAMWKISRPC